LDEKTALFLGNGEEARNGRRPTFSGAECLFWRGVGNWDRIIFLARDKLNDLELHARATRNEIETLNREIGTLRTEIEKQTREVKRRQSAGKQ
jgi:hypothetical protein